jgi:hypothetical protein
VALLLATIVSPLPYSAIAGVLLLVQLYLVWKEPIEIVALPLNLWSIIFLPLTLDFMIPFHLSALLVFPALPLVGEVLCRNANKESIHHFAEGVKISNCLKLVIGALALTLLLSLITSSYILTFALAILSIYLTWQMIYAFRVLSDPLGWQEDVELKLISGETKKLSVELRNKTVKPLHLHIEGAYNWINIYRPEFVLVDTALVEADISAKFAGSADVQLKVSICDQMGLLKVGYTVDCAKLVIIPRAKYSEWLARKFMEQGAGSFSSSEVSFTKASLPNFKAIGTEYHSSHLYSPGDNIKEIDWKHTARLRELVVKKYQNMYGNAAVVLLNLIAGSIYEVDRISSDLLNSVLTLARNSIRSVLVVYNEYEVVEMTSVMQPDALLRKVMYLIESISITKPSVRYLWPPDIKKLNRARRKLANVNQEPAKRLLTILDIESDAVQMASSRHPLSMALTKIISVVTPPAMLIPMTSLNHDAEVLRYMLPKMEGIGYTVTGLAVDNLNASGMGMNLA